MRWGPIFYGLAFVVLLPLLLVAWAAKAQPQIALPVPGSSTLGAALVLAGLILTLAGIASIIRFGEGLPMNAYPPARYVDRGAYRLLRHPIYVGFGLAAFGVALAAGSSAGFWLVAPAAALGAVALVLGYERIDRERRFGPARPRPWLSLPPPESSRPSAADRLAVFVLVLLPWLAVYESLAALAPGRDAIDVFLAFERRWPVLEWTEAVYASTYVVVLIAPLAARRQRDLRAFAVDGLLATGLAGLLWITLPVTASFRPFEASGILGRLLLFERAHDVATNAFPSFHVIWAFLAARVFSSRWPGARLLWLGLAWGIAASCVTTGMHALADVAAGAFLYLAVSRRRAIWDRLRARAESIANSWREWRWGPVRIINHALYAGGSGALAVGGVVTLLGLASLPATLVVATLGILGAAFSAQWIEGSPKLLRPYGYFGGVAAVILGSVAVARVFGIDAWRLVAAFSVMAPWAMVFGRLRCLVQGCCHGSPCPEWLGIRYRRPESRVDRVAGMTGLSLHPTPLYSILWSLGIGLLVLRLWLARAPLSVVAGVYLLLSGVGRFVEEAYRGEPQTPIRGGLRLYQWLALISVAGGALATTWPTAAADGVLHPSRVALFAAIAFGLFTAAAYGVDVPKSGVRFARLT